MELHTGYRKQNATFSEIIGEEEIIGTTVQTATVFTVSAISQAISD